MLRAFLGICCPLHSALDSTEDFGGPEAGGEQRYETRGSLEVYYIGRFEVACEDTCFNPRQGTGFHNTLAKVRRYDGNQALQGF